MPVRSLRSMATATAIRYVKVLDDLGALPYVLARPILLKIDNPEKLHTIELASPHLAAEDTEIWMDFIKRDIPRWDTYQLPAQSDDWYSIYCDLREQTDRTLDADAEMMRKAIDGINNKRAALTPQIIPQSKSHRMAHARPTPRQRHAAYDRRMGGIGADTYNMPRSDNWGSKKKNSIFQPIKRNNALTVPTKALNNRASQVQRAPRALVEEHQESRRSIPPKGSLLPAGKNPGLPSNEDKLRALTNSAQPVSNSGVKRRASSPPTSTSTASPGSSQPGPSTSKPVMKQRPAPSIFMPPKRRRM